MVRVLVIMLFCVSVAHTAKCAQLLQPGDIINLGAFRLPQGTQGCGNEYQCTFSHGGKVIALGNDRQSLYVSSHDWSDTYAARVSIPNPVNTAIVENMNTAILIEAFADITEGHDENVVEISTNVTPGDTVIGGMIAYDGKLYGTLHIAFDNYSGADATVRTGFRHSLTLSETGTFVGNFKQFLSGYLGKIPTSLQMVLGGDLYNGLGPLSIITRASMGPSMRSWVADDMVDTSEIITTHSLISYPDGHRTLGEYANTGPANPYISPADRIWGTAIIDGTDTVIFVGMHGTGDWCYKSTCTGELYPVEPSGNEAKPNIAQVWAYDINDLIAVYSGHVVTAEDVSAGRFISGSYPNNTVLSAGSTVMPYNVKPYAVWELEVSAGWVNDKFGSIAYDSDGGLLYISQPGVDNNANPLINVFTINIAAPTCSDQVQNGDETGVDCGGSCPACSTPGTLQNKAFTFGTAPMNFIEE